MTGAASLDSREGGKSVAKCHVWQFTQKYDGLFEGVMKALRGKCVCFKILFHAFSERQTGLSGAKCERNTMSHCGRGGDGERASTSGVHREGEQYYSEAPTQSTQSAAAHGLSHGNCSDNLTPVDQTGLRTDCTQCCRARGPLSQIMLTWVRQSSLRVMIYSQRSGPYLNQAIALQEQNPRYGSLNTQISLWV